MYFIWNIDLKILRYLDSACILDPIYLIHFYESKLYQTSKLATTSEYLVNISAFIKSFCDLLCLILLINKTGFFRSRANVRSA